MKDIILLIGPKGSGKSFIGILIEEKTGIKFLLVKDWVKQIRKGRTLYDETYVKEVFQLIENGVRDTLHDTLAIIFESSGFTIYFDHMIDQLNRDYQLILNGVYADPDTCLQRVRSRDQSIHVNVSD